MVKMTGLVVSMLGVWLQPNAQRTVPTYLRGVVPRNWSAPYAAVEAQAIIARTHALRNLRRFGWIIINFVRIPNARFTWD